MDDTFKIFILRLKEGEQEIIEETLAPTFLDIHEEELTFQAPIAVSGKASVADTTLILQLAIETEALMPCSICNQKIPVKIAIPDLCYNESLDEIKNGVFDYQEVLREAILLELPYTVECNGGACPERETLLKYTSQK